MGVLWLAVWGSHGVERGDVDWLSASIALPGLGVAIWSARMSRTALRLQVTDTAVQAARLADAVTRAETPERARLLGGEHTPIDLRFVLRPAPAHNADGADPDGRLATVVDYYRRLRPRRLVITGAPGSGKTVLALELLLALLENRDPKDPVPVRMSLASWSRLPDTSAGVGAAAGGAAIEEWVRDHLERVYRLTPATARALVEAGMILPVLDGLDEMDSTDTEPRGTPGPGPGGSARGGPRARRALEILNAYALGRARAKIVLTCRSGPYEALETWTKDAARVEITPVTPIQGREFILARVEDPRRWREVIHALDTAPSGSLARGLSTPWRLTMAVTVHEQRDPGSAAYRHQPRNLLSPALARDEDMRDHLNGFYLRATADHPGDDGDTAYSPDRVHIWLAVLARHLAANSATPRMLNGRTLSGTDLVPHELWPLAGLRRARLIHTVLVVCVGLVAAAVMARESSPLLYESSWIANSVAVLFGASVSGMLGLRWGAAWPGPTHLVPGRLTTREGRRELLTLLALGAAGVLAVMIIGALDRDFDTDPSVVLTLAWPLTLGVASLIVRGRDDDGRAAVADPRDLVRDELAGTLVAGLAVGATVGLALGFAEGLGSGLGDGIRFGSALGLVAFLAIMLMATAATQRYALFLLCVRTGPRALPWRLGRFLHWATTAGLLRTAGTAYQFRHRELQDWLARNPVPHP
ncbi:NACHT domain-containing protein [Embleya sp. NPDC127516]|uniref:NACHT domain-containing protein n=1 Tax=Embleya sp. NPDC127516 TaxID=3363990 RepID=UPI00381EE993